MYGSSLNRHVCRKSAEQTLKLIVRLAGLLIVSVTADEDGPADFVRVCVVFPGLKKKFFKNAAKNAELDVKYDTRYKKFFRLGLVHL